MSFCNRILARSLRYVPRSLVARVARRYVAGSSRGEALEVVRQLRARGLLATVDLLGENVSSPEAAAEVTNEYLELLSALSRQESAAHISVKLTHLGLRLDEELARQNVTRLVERAAELGSFVRIDMEDSTTTDAALRIFRRLRETREEVGIAVQAYLHRSADDVNELLSLRPNLRICKGIYREPAKLAWQDLRRIRESFLSLVRAVLGGGGFVAIATHDPYLVESCLRLVRDRALLNRYEFQMLCGVGVRLRPRILEGGSPLRIYCPYGPDWYDYSMRRLEESPRMVGHVLRELFSKNLFSPVR